MVKRLLSWNKSLTTKVDKDGSTPLHFASAMCFWTGSYLRYEPLSTPTLWPFIWCPWRSTWALLIVLEANPAALYQADNNGFFPIHVAASVGAWAAISHFLLISPDNAGLRDAKGKTFLHVAIEKRMVGLVSFVCQKPSLAWILNMQDNNGNTALHLAIQARSFRMFCALFGNPEVNLNITNKKGETPRGALIRKSQPTMGYAGNSENQISYTLWYVGANTSSLRQDKANERFHRPLIPKEQKKESERLKDATQRYIIASVLIANMAFSATFSIPGGYRADEHRNGGTPTLAGGYIFDSFIMATALALISSLLATTGFMIAGVPMVNLITRKNNLYWSMMLFSSSVTCMSIAFALGVYMVLAPVAPHTAAAVCAITSAIILGKDIGFLSKMKIRAGALCSRGGLFLGIVQSLRMSALNFAFMLWPFLIIFGWGWFAKIRWSLPQIIRLQDVIGGILLSYMAVVYSAVLARIRGWRYLLSRVNRCFGSH